MPTTALEIHPAIGIARVGSSEEFHLGPQPGEPLPDDLRDSAKNLKRQAARFRVFRCVRDNRGALLSANELTAADGMIEWRVHLVNRKSASRNFLGSGRRNNATGNDATDKDLIVDSGSRRSGLTSRLRNSPESSAAKPFGLAIFERMSRVDLIVCGGFGVSEAVPPQPSLSSLNFADNENWFDDTADGPIGAVLRTPSGAVESVRSAWIMVGPPDFAPEIQNLVTLYDVAFQAAVDAVAFGCARPGVVCARHPTYLASGGQLSMGDQSRPRA